MLVSNGSLAVAGAKTWDSCSAILCFTTEPHPHIDNDICSKEENMVSAHTPWVFKSKLVLPLALGECEYYICSFSFMFWYTNWRRGLLISIIFNSYHLVLLPCCMILEAPLAPYINIMPQLCFMLEAKRPKIFWGIEETVTLQYVNSKKYKTVAAESEQYKIYNNYLFSYTWRFKNKHHISPVTLGLVHCMYKYSHIIKQSAS